MKTINKDLSNPVSVISFEKIERTDFYKKMSKFQKNFFSQNKKHVTRQIHHGFNVANHLGFEGWEKQTDANYQVKQIVQELVNEGV